MLSLIAATAVALAPITVGVHDDMPTRAAATCELAVNLLGDTTRCVQLPTRQGPKIDLELYLDPAYDGPLSCAVVVAHLDPYTGRCAADTSASAPAGPYLGADAGTTGEVYDFEGTAG